MENKPLEPMTDIAAYYSGKLAEHGDTPRGVDWNGADGQALRFEQLAKVIKPPHGFSLHDLGCGYGAFCEYLEARFQNFHYHGHDVSADMVQAARRRLGSRPRVSLSHDARLAAPADYAITSGIFNVRLRRSDAEWRAHMESTLDMLHEASRQGFSFNCLTIYSDQDRMRPDLYYADPLALFDRCKRRYSREVALLHDYGLFEFTIIVRK
jgi:SAM-dependent methyltransferase